MKILGMGNALVDVLVRIDDDNELKTLDLPKGSMQLIDDEGMCRLNAAIEKKERFYASGGSASNTITALAKLGIETGFIGKIGKDSFGDFLIADHKKYGVKSHLKEVDGISGIATTLISTDGERTFGTYLGAAATLTAGDLDEKIFADYQYFYIEGYLVQNLELIRKALRLAKKARMKIILDLASYNVVEQNRDFLIDIIPGYVDIVFANEEELNALIKPSAEKTLSFLEDNLEFLIVKTGEKGSWVKQSGQDRIDIKTERVDCIDTTGAGDFYAAGFLYGFLKGYSISRCGEIGTLLARNIIQVVGAKLDDSQWKLLMNELGC